MEGLKNLRVDFLDRDRDPITQTEETIQVVDLEIVPFQEATGHTKTLVCAIITFVSEKMPRSALHHALLSHLENSPVNLQKTEVASFIVGSETE